MASTPMSPAELSAARTRLGLTPDEFAAELGLPPHAYVACEAGEAKLPKREAQHVAFLVACAERDEALAQSGLPTCAWIEQWEREEPSLDTKAEARLAHVQRAETHAKSCATCLAREQFVRERFPDMPKPPVAGWIRIFGVVAAWVEARPAWMRPAIYGAAAVAAMTSIRAVFMLLGAVREPRLALLALGAVAAAALAGAGGGLVYSFLGRPVRRVPVVGPYLAGIVAVAGYLGSFGVLMALGGEDLAEGGPGASLVAFGFVSILFGLVVGHQWFRPEKADA